MAKQRIEVRLVRDGQDAVRKDARGRWKAVKENLKTTVSDLRNALKIASKHLRGDDLKTALFILNSNLSEAQQRVMESAFPVGFCRGAELTTAMMERAVFEGNRKQSNKED
jgi:hypothetical protein